MDWITESIAIGTHLEAQDAELLRNENIQSVLSLDGSLAPNRTEEFGLAKIVTTILIDGAGNDLRVFDGAVESLIYLARTKPPVLVQCHAGRSRSVAVVAGFLLRAHNLDPDEAIRQVASKRECNIAAALRDLLYKL